jgi:hypothetical protein
LLLFLKDATLDVKMVPLIFKKFLPEPEPSEPHNVAFPKPEPHHFDFLSVEVFLQRYAASRLQMVSAQRFDAHQVQKV